MSNPELTEPIYARLYGDVINPPVPERPQGRRKLLDRCLGAIAWGFSVTGVTPRHVSPDGMYLINHPQHEKNSI
jgi:hypothetical protein